MYVWLDALTNYVTASGWPVDGPAGDAANIKTYGRLTCIWSERIFCSFMPSIGRHFLWRLVCQYQKEFLHMAGGPMKAKKFQKSLGNAIDPNLLADQYGIDQTRYFCFVKCPLARMATFPSKRWCSG